MNANVDLERRLADFYAGEAPERAPNRVLEAALASIDGTRQRRALPRVPWRFPIMNGYTKFAIAAVAVIAIGAVGLAVLRPGLGTGPGGGMPAVSPALTETFTSTIHGISVSYPVGWTTDPATVSWQTGLPGDTEGARDTIDDGDSSFIGLASQPLGGKTGEAWANDLLADPVGFCRPPTEPITVAGSPGVLAHCSDAGVNGLLALVWDQDRGYWIVTYRIDDRAWFDAVLASVELHPEDVAPASSATP